MPRSPSQSEHDTKPSPGSYAARPPPLSNFAARDPSKRPDITTQQSAPTLPSVASLTGYGAAPQAVAPGEMGSPVSFRLGVHSMLNPPAEAEHTKSAQRVSQSPGRGATTHAPHQTPIVSPRVRKRREDSSPRRASQSSMDARQGRRMLTPKSPSLRSISQGMRGSPSTGSRTSNPHGDGRVYMAEPGDTPAGHVPPLPPISMGPHGQYNIVQHHEQFANAGPGSLSNSTTSYSGNNQGYIGSPSSSSNMAADRENTSPFRPSISDSTPRTSSNQHYMGGPDMQSRGPNRAYGAGQPAYQMQISTDQGPMAIPVEIDLQQASKSADEKRKRNAGASARFRQRRKEKEQAASAHIADLQRELRNLSDQRDYYRSERNFLRDVIARTPGIQLPPRPPSPQMRSSGGAPMVAAPESLSGLDYGRRDMSEPSPAQRRRTSDYQPAFGSAPTPQATYPPSYPHNPAPGPGYALPPPSLPAPMQDARVQPPNTYMPAHNPQQGPPPSAPLRPQQHDPFRRDMNTR